MKRILAILLAALLVCSCAYAEGEPLKKGDKGDEVVELQLKLIEHNYLAGGADGDFGGKTEKAVKAVQADAGLEQTGIADEATLEYLEDSYAELKPTKDSDILMYSLTCDISDPVLVILVKNTGRKAITSFTFKMYQCNDSKTSLGTFFGKRNSSTKKKRTEYWTEHTAPCLLETGETYTAYMNVAEGATYGFSSGGEAQVQWFDKGTTARVVLSEFITEDGKKHKVNQKLYAKFR